MIADALAIAQMQHLELPNSDKCGIPLALAWQGLKERSGFMKMCLCCCCCLRICGLGKTKKNKVMSQEEELMNMDIEDQ